MENIGGSLGFRATLDIDDFQVSAQTMERQIRDFSNSAIREVGEVDDSIRKMAENAGRYISYYLVGQGMHGLVNSIIQTRGQFQQLDIAFETMLGNEAKANALMQQMIDTAAKTPFDLMGVAEGAKQLMAYGVSAEKVNDTLVRLGNIASGLSIPLNDIVYLYGTTMVQGRLYAQDVRQFTGRGIPLVKELAEKYHKTTDEINAMVSAGKIGFADVEEVLNKMTNAGGQFYNLMEKQSASLTGQIANLEDAWDTVLNDWGEAGQDLFSTAISGATYFVEHMDDVLRIVKAIAIAYGSYKAALVLTSVAMKGQTGITVLDNTVKSAKIALLKAETALNGTATAQIKAMTAAENEHYAALEAMLTAEERAAIVKQMRIAAIQSLLTAQQQEYLSNIGLTASSSGYEAAALSIMTVEQRLALSKVDLTNKSAAYRAAIAQETAAKQAGQAASLEAMRTSVKEAAVAVESAKSKAIAATQAVEAARYEVYWAQQSGNATAIAAAQKRLEAAVDQQALTRKAALAAQSDFYTKKKQLETVATAQGRAASVADTAAKTAQTAATSVLSAATGKLTAGLKALWATMMANPIGAILAVVGLLISAFVALGDSEDDAAESMKKFGDSGESQLSNLQMLLAVLENTKTNSSTYKKAFEELNALLQENGLEALKAGASIDEVREAYDRLTEAVKRNSAETERGNALASVQAEYNTALDEIGKTIQKELSEAHHYDSFLGMSFDSADIQAKATALAGQIRGVIQDALPEIVNLDDAQKERAKAALRAQITDIMTAAGIDKQHAQFITDYSWLDDMYYDVFSESGGIIDQAIAARQAFDDQTNAANAAADAIVGMGNASENTAPQIEISTLSLSELHDLENKISTTPADVQINVYGYEDAMAMLRDVQAMIGQKQNDLNTESGISAEIQSLKKLRSEAQLGSQAWKDYNAQITTLETKLNSATGRGVRNGANDAARAAETLAQKQLDAERRLEEARIAVMEDGYDKRKALLDLQFKQDIDRINKEERELAKARKEDGQGGLSASETGQFEQRRQYAKQNYDRDSAKLFVGELDYKRKQYELYWRWVENMGKDVADKQFASLLQSGTSFKSYLEKQIAELQTKKAAGALTEGESNFLISLNVQYDELTGAKSALDAFRESVSNTISRSQTLAEKLAAVAEAKRKLESGESGLNADDTATAYTEYDKMDADLRKEVQDTVLRDYRSFEEQRKSIQDEYALLRAEAQRMGDEERVRLINQGESEALSALNASMLMQSESWKNLFSDLDALTVDEIDKLITDIQTKMNTADLKLNPADLKAVLDRLDEARQKVLDTNPFKAMGRAISDVFKKSEKGAKKSSKQIKTEWKNLASATEGCFDFVNEALDSCSVLSDLLGDTGKNTIQMLQGMAMAGIAMASAIKTAEKGSIILTAISIALQAITWIATLFNKDTQYEEKIQSLQRGIDALERSCDRLKSAFDRTYWVFNDEEKAAYEQRIEYIEEQKRALESQAKIAARAWKMADFVQIMAQIKKLNKELSNAKEGGDMLSIYEAQKESLRKQQVLIEEQIKNEQNKKKTDIDKIIQWENAIEDIDEQIAELERSMLETFAGTTTKEALDQYADAIVDAYCAGEDAAKALGDTTREVLKKAVVDALKRQFLAKAMDEAIQYLGEAMSDGELTDREKSKFEAMVNAAGATFTNALEAVGDWIKDVEDDAANTDPLAGAIAAMSEETGGVIAGRLNVFIINQTEQTNVLREQLLAQSAIAQNTATANTILTEVRDTLKRIETKDNSLLSQGIS